MDGRVVGQHPNRLGIADNLLSSASVYHAILLAIAAYLLWALALAVYRLYFSPLAKFPGDRLAAATGWVETYHDVFRGGQFIFKIGEWHAKYGPVVRINPWEIHIADPDFTEVIYAGNSRFNKKIEWKYRFGLPHSTFDTIDHDHHRLRRGALAPFFSKQKINSVVDYISHKTHRLCDRLDAEFKGTGQPVVLNSCFTALTFDIITQYAFGRSFEYMEDPAFEGPFTNAAKQLATTLHAMGHFPWLLALVQALPRRLAAAVSPPSADVQEFHDEIEKQIREIQTGTNDAHKYAAHKTVFNELLNSDLPPAEKAVERLRHEGGSVVAGGVETTATALQKACFFILANPRIHHALRTELLTVFPDPRQTPALATLEALPYLSATVDETLRLSIGLSSRTIRKSVDGPVVHRYRRQPDGQEIELVIPKGAYFSMTTYYTHTYPVIWGADAQEFRPERWLLEDAGGAQVKTHSQPASSSPSPPPPSTFKRGQPLAPNGLPLSRYLVPFGRGPRVCVGMNLARAELVIGLAVVLRRCNFTLFETGREDIDMKADYLIPFADPNSKGVRVLVE